MKADEIHSDEDLRTVINGFGPYEACVEVEAPFADPAGTEVSVMAEVGYIEIDPFDKVIGLQMRVLTVGGLTPIAHSPRFLHLAAHLILKELRPVVAGEVLDAHFYIENHTGHRGSLYDYIHRGEM